MSEQTGRPAQTRPPSLKDLEDQAIRLAREIYQDGRNWGLYARPMDAGFAAQVADVVLAAYQAGEARATLVARSAIEEWLNANRGHLLSANGYAQLDKAIDDLKELLI